MGDHQVVRTAKEDVWLGVHHRHIAALCLADRTRVSKQTAISDINSGRESYWTYADGQRAAVRVVGPCSQCRATYLRTDRDTTTKDNLLALPDC